MADSGVVERRDLVTLVVNCVGAVVETDVLWESYRLVDPGGEVVASVTEFLHELQASGRSAATQRSYALDLLRWFRFLWAVDVPWVQATRCEARDFCRWLALVDKPRRGAGSWQSAGAANAVTGKRSPGSKYVISTLAHSETVLRSFYDFHLEAGSGPIVNPFPLVRERVASRAHAHHNPMEPFAKKRSGRYRPRLAQRVPRRIPDDRFNQVFAQLRSDRDRALVAFWVSTGARAAELLGARGGDVDPGQQLITVIRKGSRAVQQLPASAEPSYGYGSTKSPSAPRSLPGWMTRCGGRTGNHCVR
jgi:integrase